MHQELMMVHCLLQCSILTVAVVAVVAVVVGIEIEPKLYLDEALTMDTMEKFGVDAEEDEAMLEEENDPLKKVIMASAAGASALGEDDPDAQDTLSVMNNISGAFDPDDPEDMKKQFEVYKKAGEIFFDVEDLKEMVPEPDKALPWLVAGASLVQSGESGDSWGTALSKAFTQYAGADYKERKAPYSNNGPGIDLYAPADETLAAGMRAANGDQLGTETNYARYNSDFVDRYFNCT